MLTGPRLHHCSPLVSVGGCVPVQSTLKYDDLVLALGEETAVKAAVGSIAWPFRRFKKPKCRGMNARSYVLHSVCTQLLFCFREKCSRDVTHLAWRFWIIPLHLFFVIYALFPDSPCLLGPQSHNRIKEFLRLGGFTVNCSGSSLAFRLVRVTLHANHWHWNRKMSTQRGWCLRWRDFRMRPFIIGRFFNVVHWRTQKHIVLWSY